jgi:hypothetical protein
MFLGCTYSPNISRCPLRNLANPLGPPAYLANPGSPASEVADFRCKLLQLKLHATLAQLVERLIRNQQVAGSIPAGGSSSKSITYNPSSRPKVVSCKHGGS